MRGEKRERDFIGVRERDLIGVGEESYGGTFGSESSQAASEADYIAYQHVQAQPPQHHSLCLCERECVRACGGGYGCVWKGVSGCGRV